MHGRTLDAGDIAGRNLEHFDIEAAGFRPAQIHAQQHFRPILSFGAARTGLNIDESAARIHLTCEHPPKLKPLDNLDDFIEFRGNIAERILIVFVLGQNKKLGRFSQGPIHTIEFLDDGFERGPLAP
jgi:hypothetical protein